MDADPLLRALYRLAKTVEGESLERVREAIAARRSALELETRGPSAWDALPAEEPAAWQPGDQPFQPAARDEVPVRARRKGERGYRIVGTRAKHRSS